MDLILYTPRTSYLTNNVIFKTILLYGKPGSGKTELGRALVEKAVEKYGQKNVHASITHNGDLTTLLELGLDEEKLVQILFADNVTLVRPKKVEIQNFFKLRHYYRMLTGKNNGLIISILGAHRFHGVDISLRTDLDFLIARNSPTNPWDLAIMRRFLGDTGISIMEVLEEERITNKELFKFSVFYTKRAVGILELPLAKENYFKELDTYYYPTTTGVYHGKISTASFRL